MLGTIPTGWYGVKADERCQAREAAPTRHSFGLLLITAIAISLDAMPVGVTSWC
jgi:hypothetical protein